MKYPNKYLLSGLALIALVALFFSSWQNADANAGESSTPRTLIHILDYIASDYGGAVENGKIINMSEHKEHQELLESAHKLLKEDQELNHLEKELQSLESKVRLKVSEKEIGEISQKIKNEIIEISHLEMAPKDWPNLHKGRELFEQQCSTCHGMQGRGDGPRAKNLNPKPFNFQDPKLMAGLSPFKIYNAVRVGIAGTAMAPFPNIGDKDLWATAFYVASLQHSWISEKDSAKFFERALGKVPLEKVASLTDSEIEASFQNEKDKKALIAALRLHSAKDDAQGNLAIASYLINESLAHYKAGETDAAAKKALSAYLDGIEPVEPRIKAKDPQALIEIEKVMAEFRSKIEHGAPITQVEEQGKKAFNQVQSLNQILSSTTTSPGLAFFMAFSILLREAFEAVLVIIALLGVLRATNAKTAAKWVHGGWMAAVAMGFALWIFSGMLLDISGAGREMMEGVISIIAVGMLLYMGFWLHSKTEIGRWNAFIKGRVEDALTKGSLWGLAFISFTAVGREALETVLFLRTIWFESGSQEGVKTGLVMGVAFAFAATFILAWALLKYSAKIPIRKLFSYSSAVMVVLSFIMMGKAIHAIQEAGKVSITYIPWDFRIDLLGLFPTVETLLAQAAVLVLVGFLWTQTTKSTQRSRSHSRT